jgi:anthranilate phosphoribosyltransferase
MTVATPPPWFHPTLDLLVQGRHLDGVSMCRLMQGLLTGECGEAETAALLVALRMKGETAGELASAAAVLREHMVPFDAGRTGLLDTCGTGGSGRGTFNISTAAALVVAGAGVPVVKHGNRAMSGRTGSADVLAALGVNVEGGPAGARRCLDAAGMAFCLAPQFHPALRHIGPVRRRLGVSTLFNCLGPLANPARAAYHLLGVGRPEWLDKMAEAVARIGTGRAVLVCGDDGLDEVTLAAPTRVREVAGGQIVCREWTPDDFGLAPCDPHELRVEGVEESAAVIRRVLSGEGGPAARVVLANAAAALLAAEEVTDLKEGVARAAETVAGGRARKVLENLIAASRPEFSAGECAPAM